MKSGVYFVGTTNYPERIDPAFINRPGRFDRMFEIDNPSEPVRREYFDNSNIENILSMYTKTLPSSDNKNLSIVDLFVKYSEDLSMASLKELMVSTAYMLVSNNSTIEECLEKVSSNLKNDKNTHVEEFNKYHDSRRKIPTRRYDDYED